MIQAIREWGGRPVARALLLSVALHVAIIMLVQPRFDTRGGMVVLHARLVHQEQEAPTQAVPEEPVPQHATASEPATETDSRPLQAEEPPAPIQPAVQTPKPDAQPDGAPLPDTSSSAEAGNAPVAAAAPAPAIPEPVAELPSVPVMQDLNWYWARQVDRRPLPLHDIVPVYPEEARRSGLQGSVVIELRIDEFGKVHEVAIIEADPPGTFEASVLKAYTEAIFTPALREGRPVRYLGRYRVRFDLE